MRCVSVIAAHFAAVLLAARQTAVALRVAAPFPGVRAVRSRSAIAERRRWRVVRFEAQESTQEKTSTTDAATTTEVDDATPPAVPEKDIDENPDQPDIVKKFVKQRDDWWAEGAFASPLSGATSTDEGPLQALAAVPIPAYFWLLTSTVLLIAFVGCIFQLFYNVPPAPVLGVPATTAVLVASGPGFLFVFLLAIARGQKEADEDDARYS